MIPSALKLSVSGCRWLLAGGFAFVIALPASAQAYPATR